MTEISIYEAERLMGQKFLDSKNRICKVVKFTTRLRKCTRKERKKYQRNDIEVVDEIFWHSYDNADNILSSSSLSPFYGWKDLTVKFLQLEHQFKLHFKESN